MSSEISTDASLMDMDAPLPAPSEANCLMRRGCYVMLHIGTGLPGQTAEWERCPPVVVSGSRRFALNDDFWIEKLDEQLAIHIQAACDPPHYGINNDQTDRHLYAFLRRVPTVEASQYEGMDELHAVVALSRLVHLTSTGDRYSAWILRYGSPESPIKAVQYRGISPDLLLSRHQRDWISVEDAECLRQLMPWASKKKLMHERVHRAFWNHEYAMRSFYLDTRWPIVVSGLEALLNVGEQNSGPQFKGRVRLLADEFGLQLSGDEISKAWKLRSKLVHAEGFLHNLETILPKREHSDLYEKMEGLLRMAVRRCLLDASFGDCFRDDAAVKARWPI